MPWPGSAPKSVGEERPSPKSVDEQRPDTKGVGEQQPCLESVGEQQPFLEKENEKNKDVVVVSVQEISKEEYQRVKNTILEVVQESLSQAQMPEESPLTPFKSRLPNGKFAIDLDDDSGPATGHPVVQKDKKGLISCLTCGTRMWLV